MEVSILFKEARELPDSTDKFLKIRILKILIKQKKYLVTQHEIDNLIDTNRLITEIKNHVGRLTTFLKNSTEWRRKCITLENVDNERVVDILSIYTTPCFEDGFWQLYATELNTWKILPKKKFRKIKLYVNNHMTLFRIDDISKVIKIKNEVINDKINLLMEELNKLNIILENENYNNDEINNIKQQIKQISIIVVKVGDHFKEYDIVNLMLNTNYLLINFDLQKTYSVEEIKKIINEENKSFCLLKQLKKEYL
jgi:hypothetical protein